MKNTTLLHAVSTMYVALIIADTSCQPIMDFASMNTPEIHKKQNGLATPVNIGRAYINTINIKAVRTFIKEFKNAQNVSWSKGRDGDYVAKFTIDSVQTIVRYDSRGSWFYTMKRYAEKQMSPELRELVKSIYIDYTIAQITELNVPNEKGIIYNIVIKTTDNFKTLRIYDGKIEITGDYTMP